MAPKAAPRTATRKARVTRGAAGRASPGAADETPGSQGAADPAPLPADGGDNVPPPKDEAKAPSAAADNVAAPAPKKEEEASTAPLPEKVRWRVERACAALIGGGEAGARDGARALFFRVAPIHVDEQERGRRAHQRLRPPAASRARHPGHGLEERVTRRCGGGRGSGMRGRGRDGA